MVVTRVVVAGAALAAFALVAAAPVAYADSGSTKNNGDASLKIEPSQRSYHGGDVIKLDAKCNSNRADIAVSAALDNVKEWIKTNRNDFNLQATARVRSDVKSGRFDISFRCGDQKISVSIDVDNGNRGGGGGGGTTTSRTTTTNTTTSTTVDTSTTMVYPSGAPQTGGEGPSDTGSGLLGLAELGGIVLIAGTGVGVAVTRRRRLAAAVAQRG
ncbi:hypothetical protein [Kutzneria sp. NPDC052558]|uniref:hypothetical protein n=1 Tax=Kutzneria sp. NPDC052558 TaxID=3364121 RepID=UPI0037C745A0